MFGSPQLTPYNVWQHLRDEGALGMDRLADDFGVDRDDMAEVIRYLMGRDRDIMYVSTTLDRKYEANPLDELPLMCEPFGAGAGDTTSADAPPDVPMEEL